MQLALDLLLDPIPTLENFIVGSNSELLGHLRTPPTPNIFIWGESGSGKTHLLKALANGGGIYKPAGEFDAIDTANLPKTLCIDDLEHISPAALDTLFGLQNRLQSFIE
jgi:DnaA-homolog protein